MVITAYYILSILMELKHSQRHIIILLIKLAHASVNYRELESEECGRGVVCS